MGQTPLSPLIVWIHNNKRVSRVDVIIITFQARQQDLQVPHTTIRLITCVNGLLCSFEIDHV